MASYLDNLDYREFREELRKMSLAEVNSVKAETYNQIASRYKSRGEMIPLYLMAIVEEADKIGDSAISGFFQGLVCTYMSRLLPDFCEAHIPCLMELHKFLLEQVNAKDNSILDPTE